jgi:hypothetical protein
MIMTKVTAEAEFKFRGKVNTELASQYRHDARHNGAERPKKDAATARRAATTLKNSLDAFYSLKPEQRLALSAAASVLATLAADLDGVASWAKAYKVHCDSERVRMRAEAEDDMAEKLWSGDDASMLADAQELVELFSAPGKELMTEILKQSKTFDVIYLSEPDDSRRLDALRLAGKAQPADMKKFRRDAAYCVDQMLSRRGRLGKTYKGETDYEVGGQDWLALKAWRKAAVAAVAACAPAMSTNHADDAHAEVPLDTEFWSQVEACQAADDAEHEAFDSEFNKPYRLSAE